MINQNGFIQCFNPIPELTEIVDMADLVETGLVGAVVHGNGHLGLQGADDLIGRLGADGIITAYGDEHTVDAVEGIFQLLVGETAQVAQMGHPDAAAVENADGIHTALGAAAVIVGRFKFRDGPGQGRGLLQSDGLGEVVVGVAVAAIDGVGGQVQIGLSGDHSPGIGIDDGLGSLVFQGKAGVAVVGEFDFHSIPSKTKTPPVLADRGR